MTLLKIKISKRDSISENFKSKHTNTEVDKRQMCK